MKNIKGAMWDMDGVVYPFSEECTRQYKIAVAKAALELVSGLSFELATTLLEKSYAETGSYYRLLKQYYGLTSRQLNGEYHQHMNFDFIKPNPSLITKIKQMNIKHVLLTQGYRQSADKILNNAGLAEIFPVEMRIVFEDLAEICDDDNPKASSIKPVELGLQKLGCVAEETIFIEDTPVNLFHPEKLGITTMLVYPSASHKPENYIHHIFKDTESAVDYFLAAQVQPL